MKKISSQIYFEIYIYFELWARLNFGAPSLTGPAFNLKHTTTVSFLRNRQALRYSRQCLPLTEINLYYCARIVNRVNSNRSLTHHSLKICFKIGVPLKVAEAASIATLVTTYMTTRCRKTHDPSLKFLVH